MEQADVLNMLRDLKPELAQYKVKEIALFGSFARNEQERSSDIDVLLDFEEDASLFDLVRVGDFLEGKLHQRVDIVPKESLREEIRQTVLQEMVIL